MFALGPSNIDTIYINIYIYCACHKCLLDKIALKGSRIYLYATQLVNHSVQERLFLIVKD